ncbi:MADS-box transcription factor 22 [Apostasia shenzhenica]|uniref:MADS-box transcription factor 22 n=1 Tax=Apostasia shenzhenica TaxID=1088818 RepID=A0A2I0B5Y3_9ASPA|nr:MADS-box transcription factor 22 [Apostasia shenzhenica]
MENRIERHNMHSKNLLKPDQPSVDSQLENGCYARLCKQLAEATRLIRHMRGEDLQGLTVEELRQLEKILESGCCRVRQRKSEQIMEEISNLQKRGVQLMEENTRLRHQMTELSRMGKQAVVDLENPFNEDGLSSESVVTLTPGENDDTSVTSLKLG